MHSHDESRATSDRTQSATPALDVGPILILGVLAPWRFKATHTNPGGDRPAPPVPTRLPSCRAAGTKWLSTTRQTAQGIGKGPGKVKYCSDRYRRGQVRAQLTPVGTGWPRKPETPRRPSSPSCTRTMSRESNRTGPNGPPRHSMSVQSLSLASWRLGVSKQHTPTPAATGLRNTSRPSRRLCPANLGDDRPATTGPHTPAEPTAKLGPNCSARPDNSGAQAILWLLFGPVSQSLTIPGDSGPP